MTNGPNSVTHVFDFLLFRFTWNSQFLNGITWRFLCTNIYPKGRKAYTIRANARWVKLGVHPIDFYRTHTWLMALHWYLLHQILRITVKKYRGNGWVFIYTLKWSFGVTVPIFTKLTVKKLHFEFHENPTNANTRPRTDGCGFHVVISVVFFTS